MSGIFGHKFDRSPREAFLPFAFDINSLATCVKHWSMMLSMDSRLGYAFAGIGEYWQTNTMSCHLFYDYKSPNL